MATKQMGPAMTLNEIDKIGLMQDAFQIEGISDAECRSIFLDWALKLPMGTNTKAAIQLIIETYAQDPGHPMSVVLRQGLVDTKPQGRRGGRLGRQPLH